MSAALSQAAPAPPLAPLPSVPDHVLDMLERRHTDLGAPNHRLLFFAALKRKDDREVTPFALDVAKQRLAELQDQHPEYEPEDAAIVLLARGARTEALAAALRESPDGMRTVVRGRLREVSLTPLLVESSRLVNTYRNLGRGGRRRAATT